MPMKIFLEINSLPVVWTQAVLIGGYNVAAF